jgi:hypothetical protein
VKNRPVILRFIAILMILVFSQKSGAGLFLHNFFHKSISVEHPVKEGEHSKDLGYTCTCIDDFMMPFDEAEGTVFANPALLLNVQVTFFKEPVLFHTPVYISLRGPPANCL